MKIMYVDVILNEFWLISIYRAHTPVVWVHERVKWEDRYYCVLILVQIVFNEIDRTEILWNYFEIEIRYDNGWMIGLYAFHE